MKRIFVPLLIALISLSCARSFHPIYPESVSYERSRLLYEDVEIAYAYQMQFLARNPPAIRKEIKKGMQLIAVRIDNNTNHYVQLEESRFSVSTSSGRSIAIVSPEHYLKATRQQPETFLIFYALAGIGYHQEETTSYPSGNTTTSGQIVYSPLPPAIGIINAIVAGSANGRQRGNLMNNQLFDRPIPPGASLYGLLAISNQQYTELQFHYDIDE